MHQEHVAHDYSRRVSACCIRKVRSSQHVTKATRGRQVLVTNAFALKEMLRDLGFTWSSENRAWVADMTVCVCVYVCACVCVCMYVCVCVRVCAHTRTHAHAHTHARWNRPQKLSVCAELRHVSPLAGGNAGAGCA